MFPVPELVPSKEPENRRKTRKWNKRNKNFYIAQKISVFKILHRRVCAQAHVLRAYKNFLFHLFLTEMEESKMIRNGRPYTNENGWEDAGLITDHPKEEQDIVLNWIRRNILPEDRSVPERRKQSPYVRQYGRRSFHGRSVRFLS